MRSKSGLALGGLGSFGLGVAFATLAAGLDVQGAPATEGRGIDPATINRALKGDRLPSAVGYPARRQSEPRLPEGCVAAAEWHKNIYTAEVPGRCVA